jgi:hypothetical protein
MAISFLQTMHEKGLAAPYFQVHMAYGCTTAGHDLSCTLFCTLARTCIPFDFFLCLRSCSTQRRSVFFNSRFSVKPSPMVSTPHQREAPRTTPVQSQFEVEQGLFPSQDTIPTPSAAANLTRCHSPPCPPQNPPHVWTPSLPSADPSFGAPQMLASSSSHYPLNSRRGDEQSLELPMAFLQPPSSPPVFPLPTTAQSSDDHEQPRETDENAPVAKLVNPMILTQIELGAACKRINVACGGSRRSS